MVEIWAEILDNFERFPLRSFFLIFLNSNIGNSLQSGLGLLDRLLTLIQVTKDTIFQQIPCKAVCLLN